MNVKAWWQEFGRFVRPHRAAFAAVLALLVADAGLAVLAPWPLKLIVDHVLAGAALPAAAGWLGALPGAAGPVGLLAWLAAGTVVILLARHAFLAVRSHLEVGVGGSLVYGLGEELFDHLQRVSLRVHGLWATGDLVRRVTVDSTCVRDLLVGTVAPLLTAVAEVTLMVVIMWQLDPVLTVIGTLAALPLALAIRVNADRIARCSHKQQEVEGRIMSLAEQTLGALPAVKAFAREAQEDRRFRALAAEAIQAYLRTLVTQLRFRISVGGATAVTTALVMGVGGLRVLDGSLSVGSLLVFLAYLAALYAPMETLAYLSENYAGATARACRVREILHTAPEVRDPPAPVPLPPRPAASGRLLRLEAVTFGYDPGRPVLHGVSLEVRPGETVAVVGPSGAGKSTLAALVVRLFDPQAGRITLDGVDLRDLRLAELRGAVALVLQEAFLLPVSVADNIAYGRPDARREEIQAAAVAAEADTFIRRLPEGYDTVIGERGATLSGGERQRLAIARAILKDAPVVVLDEPTSALDAGTEAAVVQALGRLAAGRTVIVIAHRLSTVRDADRIVVMDHGRVVETGGHAELLAAQGHYHRFHRLATADPGEGPIP